MTPGYDPVRLLLYGLIPLLAINAATWMLYTHQPYVAAMWGFALIGALVSLRRMA